MRPHRQQPTRLHRPWNSPGKNTGVGCHFLLQCRKVKSESEVTWSCPTLSDPMDCSLPGSSIHGIFQARVLEWGAIAFSEIKWSSELNSPIPIDFSSLIPTMSMFTLAISCCPLPVYLDSWAYHSRFLCNIVAYSIRLYFHHQSHPQLGIVFTLAPSLHSFWSYFSTLLQ